MSINAAVVAILREHPTVAGLNVGGIHQNVVPGTADLPAISYRVMSDAKINSMDLTSTLKRARIQVNAVADNYVQADALSKAITKALDGYTGPSVDRTILTCLEQDSQDDINNTADYSRIIHKYLITHERI